MNALIELFAENKTQAAILGTLTAIFTAAVGYVFHFMVSESEKDAEIRALTTRIEQHRTEVEGTRRGMEAYLKHTTEYGAWIEAINESLTTKTLAPAEINATTIELISQYIAMQKKLATARASISAPLYQSAPLKDVQDKLILNLDQEDQLLSSRVDFLRQMLSDWPAANKAAAIHKYNLDGFQYGQEGEARIAAAHSIVDDAIRAHNDEVVAANAQLTRWRFDGKIFVCAWSYIGAYIGGIIGWRISAWRRRSRDRIRLSS